MPTLPVRRQQPNPVTPQVPIPNEFPAIPQEILDRFPSAKDWQTKLNEFWVRTNQALQEAQRQTASQVNSQVVWSVDRFLIYTNSNGTMPMFALDATGIRLGNVLVINTPDRKVYIGAGEYANNNTPFYIDTLGRFSLGANLTWNPDTSTLNITGIINATSGTIGGFDIGSDYIRDAANSFGMASTVTVGDDVRFWAGDTFANRGSAPLVIRESGDARITRLTVLSMTFSGTVISSNPATVSNQAVVQSAAGFGYGYEHNSFAFSATANNDVFRLFSMTPGIIANGKTGLSVAACYAAVLGGAVAGVATAYGVYVGTVDIATTNYGIYVATTAANYFAGVSTFNLGINATSIGATTPGTGAFTTLSATGVVTISAGAVGSPALIPSGDTNTGLWFPAADTVAFSTAGSERLRIVSGGNVGIGVTPESEPRLHVFKGSAGTDPAWTAPDVLLVENTSGTNCVIQIFTSNAATGSIMFSDTDARGRGNIAYLHATDEMQFQVAAGLRVSIGSAGAVTIANLAGVGTRAVVADSNGVLSAP